MVKTWSYWITVPCQIEVIVVLLTGFRDHLVNVDVRKVRVVWVKLPSGDLLPGEVGRQVSHLQLVTDGDHGQLHLGGEHHVGHGVGDVLGGPLVDFIYHGTHTEALTRVGRNSSKCLALPSGRRRIRTKVSLSIHSFQSKARDLMPDLFCKTYFFISFTHENDFLPFTETMN